MIIGHLPFGYIVSTLLATKLRRNSNHNKQTLNLRLFIIIGMLGAVAPDIDMLYFYFIDHRQHHHHSYWTHFPILWLGLLLISILWYVFVIDKSKALLALIFSGLGMCHILLDSIVGAIRWFAPFTDKSYTLFTVEAIYTPWWLNFILHWLFALEILFLLIALLLWYRKTKY